MTSPSNSKPLISYQENSVGESGFPEALIEDIIAAIRSMLSPLANDIKFTTLMRVPALVAFFKIQPQIQYLSLKQAHLVSVSELTLSRFF